MSNLLGLDQRTSVGWGLVCRTGRELMTFQSHPRATGMSRVWFALPNTSPSWLGWGNSKAGAVSGFGYQPKGPLGLTTAGTAPGSHAIIRILDRPPGSDCVTGSRQTSGRVLSTVRC